MQTQAPKFTPGYRVKIGYLGLYRVDQTPTTRNGDPVKSESLILGMRYLPRIKEDENGVEFVEMVGWEYNIFTNTDNGYQHRGWYSEQELLDHGYNPTADDILGGETELEMLRRLM